jgi:hypothetical protein
MEEEQYYTQLCHDNISWDLLYRYRRQSPFCDVKLINTQVTVLSTGPDRKDVAIWTPRAVVTEGSMLDAGT